MSGALGTPPGAESVRVPLDRFAPVGLNDVLVEAELMTRVDRKYLLPASEAVGILREASDRIRVLAIAGHREFDYESVYFDTADHLSYRLTAQRRRRRFKLRTRCYLTTGGAYLELKTKNGRGRTVKERLDYDARDRARLTERGRAAIAELLGRHGQDPALVDELVPSLVSRYRRATLLLPDGSRATIDTRLHWSTADAERSTALPEHAIIESKSTGAPSGLDRLLWRSGHRPSGISKFGTGTAALHPHLPRNKWNRVLRGHFSRIACRPAATAAGPGVPEPHRPHTDSTLEHAR